MSLHYPMDITRNSYKPHIRTYHRPNLNTVYFPPIHRKLFAESLERYSSVPVLNQDCCYQSGRSVYVCGNIWRLQRLVRAQEEFSWLWYFKKSLQAEVCSLGSTVILALTARRVLYKNDCEIFRTARPWWQNLLPRKGQFGWQLLAQGSQKQRKSW